MQEMFHLSTEIQVLEKSPRSLAYKSRQFLGSQLPMHSPPSSAIDRQPRADSWARGMWKNRELRAVQMHALQVLESREMEDSHEYCEGLVETSTLREANE